MRWWQRRGLGFKLALGISLTLLVMLGAVFATVSGYVQDELWRREVQAAESTNAMAGVLLEDAMMVGDTSQIQQALEKLGRSGGDRIDSVAVYNDRNVLTSFASGFPGGRHIQRTSMEKDLTDPACSVCHNLPAEERPTTAVVTLEGQEVMRSVLPLHNETRCQTCHGTGKAVLGDSIVDFNLEQYRLASTIVSVGPVAVMALVVTMVSFVLYRLLRNIVLSPLGELVSVTRAVVEGDLERQVAVRSRDEVGQVGTAFNRMTARLHELIGSLEQRVADRTRDLEQRSAYLEASSEVGRAATSILDADELIERSVNLILERFNLFYVGLFMLDSSGEWALLRAGTGEAGRVMLSRGHRIRYGEGMIGWSIANGRPRVASRAEVDQVRLISTELIETRSEAAIPLRSRGQVLGALTVQSREPEAFDSETLSSFQIMADQLATAIDNARLLTQAQNALEATRRAYGEISRQAWRQLMRGRADWGYSYAEGQTRPAAGGWEPQMAQAAQTGRMVGGNGESDQTLAIPIRVANELVGVLGCQKRQSQLDWTEDEVELLEGFGDQLGQTLERVRLHQETQLRAARERLVSEVTSSLYESLDVDQVLQTAAREISDALGLAAVDIQLEAGTELTGER